MYFPKLLKKIIIDCCAILMYPIYKGRIEKKMVTRWSSFGVESTNKCNAKCSFCIYRLNIDIRDKNTVSDEVLKYSLELFKKSGGGFFSFVSIIGDPLTDNHFLDKIKLIKSYEGIKGVSIYSNLIGLAKYNLDDFVNSGITALNVSTCLGGKAMYMRLFGIDGYGLVRKNLMNLLECNKKHGNPITITIMVRMDYPVNKNLDQNIVRVINEYLPKGSIKILANDNWDDWNGAIMQNDIPSGGEFRKQKDNKFKVPCYALYRKIQILKNGDISVCSCRISDQLVVGNIKDYSSLEKYWHGKALEKFRKKWTEGKIPEICLNCKHYRPYTELIKRETKENIASFFRKLLRR
jgi:radical SAM protein with 4Fe4S-binding SPASM domain